MKNCFISLVLIIFLSFIPLNGRAAFVTGDMLQKYCSSEDPKDVLSCANYIAGIIDYHVFMQTMGAAPELGFCLPKDVTIEEASFVVMKYLQNAPNQYGFIAAPSVIMALNVEYPCGSEEAK